MPLQVGKPESVKVDAVIGADGANSRVAKEIDAGDYDYAIAFQVGGSGFFVGSSDACPVQAARAACASRAGGRGGSALCPLSVVAGSLCLPGQRRGILCYASCRQGHAPCLTPANHIHMAI